MSVHPGLRLDDRYVLTERLASGGMGEVWKGTDEVLDRPIAVKVLRAGLAADPSFRARFRAEARTAGGLAHGSIAAVFDYGEAGDLAYLVMELVDGEPLSALLAREGPLGTDQTLEIVAQAARALHAAHVRGVVHRDVKPANLLITPDLRVKVTDFGIARPRDHEPLTATGQVMGTAHYLAPELARGEVASPLSDVYAIGIVAYECLAGRRPFEGSNQVAVATAQLQEAPPALPETVPLEVRQAVFTALAKQPAERPRSALAFAVVLEDLRRQRAAAARGVTAPGLAPSGNGRTAPAGPGEEVPALAPPPAGVLQPDPPGQGPRTAVLPTEPEDGKDGASRRDRSRIWRRAWLPLLLVAGLTSGAVALAAAFTGTGQAAGSGSGASATATPIGTGSVRPARTLPSPTAVTHTAAAVQPTSATSVTAPERVFVAESDYLHRDIGDVRNDLRDLGLQVKVRRVRGGRLHLPDGSVVGVGPTGLLVPGSTVTVVAAYQRHRGDG